MKNTAIRFIDLFAGMGGFRLGFERACESQNIRHKCVFTSEIKEHACIVYSDNFPDSEIAGDITKIAADEIPDFDVLLAGSPCQAFSNAGKRQGFLDTRGTLFFEIERILQAKNPQAFILENVEGLVNHDKASKNEKIGKTLSVILEKLTDLGYQVSWKILDSKDFSLAQSRKRVFIVGTKNNQISLNGFRYSDKLLGDILEIGKPVINNRLSKLLLSHFSIEELHGKSVKDKRGGNANIHSWDIELKGATSASQRELMSLLLKARRNKKWGKLKGIKWMDGMPLTLEEIKTFYEHPKLKEMLDDLVTKKYLKYEHPKDLFEVIENGKIKKVRKERTDLEEGYNIVAGKLSYEISKILSPNDVTPTLVATDLDRVVVTDSGGLRNLTIVEQCRLFGFPDNFQINIKDKLAQDLFGNTIPVNVVEAIATRMIREEFLGIEPSHSRHNEKSIQYLQMALSL